MAVYRCGHPAIPENTVGIKRAKCRTCDQAYGKMWRDAKRPAGQDKNLSRYGAKKPPIEGRDPSMDSMPVASAALLKALYREHPYIFHAASRAGRYVVYP